MQRYEFSVIFALHVLLFIVFRYRKRIFVSEQHLVARQACGRKGVGILPDVFVQTFLFFVQKIKKDAEVFIRTCRKTMRSPGKKNRI